MKYQTLLCAASAVALGLCASIPALAAETLNGAGSTAIYPVLSVWARDYQEKTGNQMNYQAIGSGGGIKQIESKTVDFAATDKPLKHDELTKNGLVQSPQIIISIVPVVNLPGIKPGELTLDGKTLAQIYLGTITKWNDPAIAKLNPKVKLPDTAIITVHRADGSGTTFTFTNYLGKVDPYWATQVGSDTSVAWPNGIAGKGNAGVAASVQQSSGSIGYVEFAYAMQNNMTYVDMINADGKHVAPTMAAFQAAASHADFTTVQDFYLILTNQPGPASWPIMGSTWVLLRTDAEQAKNTAVVKFLDWALKSGQPQAEKLDYVPIPAATAKQIEAMWKTSLHVSP